MSDKATRHKHGNTGSIDAAAARAGLSGRATAAAKTSDGTVEILRLFKLAKRSAIKPRTGDHPAQERPDLDSQLGTAPLPITFWRRSRHEL
ncbi:hypothetical protein ACWF95_39955 [Streptomyces vinaceus]